MDAAAAAAAAVVVTPTGGELPSLPPDIKGTVESTLDKLKDKLETCTTKNAAGKDIFKESLKQQADSSQGYLHTVDDSSAGNSKDILVIPDRASFLQQIKDGAVSLFQGIGHLNNPDGILILGEGREGELLTADEFKEQFAVEMSLSKKLTEYESGVLSEPLNKEEMDAYSKRNPERADSRTLGLVLSWEKDRSLNVVKFGSQRPGKAEKNYTVISEYSRRNKSLETLDSKIKAFKENPKPTKKDYIDLKTAIDTAKETNTKYKSSMMDSISIGADYHKVATALNTLEAAVNSDIETFKETKETIPKKTAMYRADGFRGKTKWHRPYYRTSRNIAQLDVAVNKFNKGLKADTFGIQDYKDLEGKILEFQKDHPSSSSAEVNKLLVAVRDDMKRFKAEVETNESVLISVLSDPTLKSKGAVVSKAKGKAATWLKDSYDGMLSRRKNIRNESQLRRLDKAIGIFNSLTEPNIGDWGQLLSQIENYRETNPGKRTNASVELYESVRTAVNQLREDVKRGEVLVEYYNKGNDPIQDKHRELVGNSLKTSLALGSPVNITNPFLAKVQFEYLIETAQKESKALTPLELSQCQKYMGTSADSVDRLVDKLNTGDTTIAQLTPKQRFVLSESKITLSPDIASSLNRLVAGDTKAAQLSESAVIADFASQLKSTADPIALKNTFITLLGMGESQSKPVLANVMSRGNFTTAHFEALIAVCDETPSLISDSVKTTLRDYVMKNPESDLLSLKDLCVKNPEILKGPKGEKNLFIALLSVSDKNTTAMEIVTTQCSDLGTLATYFQDAESNFETMMALVRGLQTPGLTLPTGLDLTTLTTLTTLTGEIDGAKSLGDIKTAIRKNRDGIEALAKGPSDDAPASSFLTALSAYETTLVNDVGKYDASYKSATQKLDNVHAFLEAHTQSYSSLSNPEKKDCFTNVLESMTATVSVKYQELKNEEKQLELQGKTETSEYQSLQTNLKYYQKLTVNLQQGWYRRAIFGKIQDQIGKPSGNTKEWSVYNEMVLGKPARGADNIVTKDTDGRRTYNFFKAPISTDTLCVLSKVGDPSDISQMSTAELCNFFKTTSDEGYTFGNLDPIGRMREFLEGLTPPPPPTTTTTNETLETLFKTLATRAQSNTDSALQFMALAKELHEKQDEFAALLSEHSVDDTQIKTSLKLALGVDPDGTAISGSKFTPQRVAEHILETGDYDLFKENEAVLAYYSQLDSGPLKIDDGTFRDLQDLQKPSAPSTSPTPPAPTSTVPSGFTSHTFSYVGKTPSYFKGEITLEGGGTKPYDGIILKGTSTTYDALGNEITVGGSIDTKYNTYLPDKKVENAVSKHPTYLMGVMDKTPDFESGQSRNGLMKKLRRFLEPNLKTFTERQAQEYGEKMAAKLLEDSHDYQASKLGPLLEMMSSEQGLLGNLSYAKNYKAFAIGIQLGKANWRSTQFPIGTGTHKLNALAAHDATHAVPDLASVREGRIPRVYGELQTTGSLTVDTKNWRTYSIKTATLLHGVRGQTPEEAHLKTHSSQVNEDLDGVFKNQKPRMTTADWEKKGVQVGLDIAQGFHNKGWTTVPLWDGIQEKLESLELIDTRQRAFFTHMLAALTGEIAFDGTSNLTVSESPKTRYFDALYLSKEDPAQALKPAVVPNLSTVNDFSHFDRHIEEIGLLSSDRKGPDAITSEQKTVLMHNAAGKLFAAAEQLDSARPDALDTAEQNLEDAILKQTEAKLQVTVAVELGTAKRDLAIVKQLDAAQAAVDAAQTDPAAA
ncbi:hypothetical protein DID77_04340, partial [Candidatus Marinamargulisbacteria bacterium SCGC AG-439-L15]